ncbi:MAG: hypothetical protein IJG68_01660 [Bacilli bacterium]|nr:hypothetical protein [Bacilli bacterium]
MITKTLAYSIIEKAYEDNLKTFAKTVINHLFEDNCYETTIIKSLEILSGVGFEYKEEHIDKNKALKYINDYTYKGEDVKEFTIDHIDNLTNRVYLKYVYDNDSSYTNITDVDIKEVIINNK